MGAAVVAMTDAIARLRALHEAATPGEWELWFDKNEQANLSTPEGEWLAMLPHQCVVALEKQAKANARAIAATHNAMGALLDVAEAMPDVLAYNGPIPGWRVKGREANRTAEAALRRLNELEVPE